ncbi:DUF2313 domain-containing protein [Chitinimonas viridis]|uniref:DUF2313 domain-containing protein n=1 Tax=Chitinimonas viridis TaxID=664880 RepID=A0ABT8B904_9NEIS|nr:putative phage tail protein [Chitinimonas viridis]MDN3578723.1 DUF2313 domain-containing protein [Chitinimonas viridis]
MHASLLASLLPPVSYDPNAQRLAAELAAEGARLDEVLAGAERLRLGIVPGPGMPVEFLPDWERLLALVPAPNATDADRLIAIIAKLRETGGLSRDYFARLAAAYGVDIEIVELEPFRAGVSRAGEPVYVPEIIWVWCVRILAAGPIPALERALRDLRPADTYVYFEYRP